MSGILKEFEVEMVAVARCVTGRWQQAGVGTGRQRLGRVRSGMVDRQENGSSGWRRSRGEKGGGGEEQEPSVGHCRGVGGVEQARRAWAAPHT